MGTLVSAITEYWVLWLCSLLAGAIVVLFRQLCAYKAGLLAILRNDIIREYSYYADKGYCPIYAMESITEMYKSYVALRHKGDVEKCDAISKVYEEVKRLPTKDPHKQDN